MTIILYIEKVMSRRVNSNARNGTSALYVDSAISFDIVLMVKLKKDYEKDCVTIVYFFLNRF